MKRLLVTEHHVAAAVRDPIAGAADVPERASKAESLHIGLLTGGDDRPYALGMASALVGQQIRVDFIGSDALDAPELHTSALLRFLNLRGDQREDVGALRKAVRILKYYVRLMRYAAFARPKVFHILWNNRLEMFDRTLLMIYYRVLGKRVVLTAHNVNAARRDSRDSWHNRLSLRIQYRLCAHILVHTQIMKKELVAEFGIGEERVSVIPFGINNTIPETGLASCAARERLGLGPTDQTILFFGQIAPYKGLEYLVDALRVLGTTHPSIHLIVAGKVKRGHEEYWEKIRAALAEEGIRERVRMRVGFIPDDQVEQYFKAANVVVLPYTSIFQSGVPFLAYSFGVPVIATDVGSLREDVVEGKTGFICAPRDPAGIAAAIAKYFDGELYRRRVERGPEIRQLALERHSWTTVGRILRAVYESIGRTR